MSSPPHFFWVEQLSRKPKTKQSLSPQQIHHIVCVGWNDIHYWSFWRWFVGFFLILGGKKTTNTLLSFFWSSDSHQNGIGIDLPISRTFGVFKSFEQISEIGSFPQVRVKIKHIFLTFWNHHLVMFLVSTTNTLGIQSYSQIMIGMFNHLSIVFRFHYHSQEVIGSLGIDTSWLTFFFETK